MAPRQRNFPPAAPRRRGSTSVMAMLYLTLVAAMAVAMYETASMNVQSASNLSNVDRARAAAESGLRWQEYRFLNMNRPRTTAGKIDGDVADALWPAIKDAIQADYAQLAADGEDGAVDGGDHISSRRIKVEQGGAEFVVAIHRPRPDPDDPAGDPLLRVVSTGSYGGATRTASMDFVLSKKIKFAVVGKVPIQLGRNTVVEGPIAMATANKFPPLLMLSDFTHFHSGLRSRIERFNEHLQGETQVGAVRVKNHNGYDNRISVNNSLEYNLATQAGYADVNGDAYIDEYDLFLDEFDADGDAGVSRSEFTNGATGKLYDEELFKAIDSIGAPMRAGEAPRLGYQDGRIDNYDGYAKLRGQAVLAPTATAWANNLAGQGKTINDMVQGTVASDDPSKAPVKFGATRNDTFDLSPANFDEAAAGFRPKTGPSAGASRVTATVIENAVLSPSYANGGTANERTPLGSTSYQATYQRPVFRNMTFRNVRIPKGLNALFDNCKFEGVTFVEMEPTITKPGGAVTTSASDGMSWSKRMKPNKGSFSNNTVLTATNSYGFEQGNNLRFNNCTLEGPIAGNYTTAYTHFTNSWEFTGATRFNNKADQTATIVAPQTNIEMGSFTDPSQAPSTLVGVVVAGNIDIRGTSTVDGSIIITGDGAGNTTLAYFGASDGNTDAGANPEGGYGRLNIRYNPYRALPDGINIRVDLLPRAGSYQEGSL